MAEKVIHIFTTEPRRNPRRVHNRSFIRGMGKKPEIPNQREKEYGEAHHICKGRSYRQVGIMAPAKNVYKKRKKRHCGNSSRTTGKGKLPKDRFRPHLRKRGKNNGRKEKGKKLKY